MNEEQLSQEQLGKSAQILKAMAHPVRLAIIVFIDGKKRSVTEIYKELGLNQSVASHHLGILRDKGVLISTREGKNVFYSYKNKLLSSVVECVTNCH